MNALCVEKRLQLMVMGCQEAIGKTTPSIAQKSVLNGNVTVGDTSNGW